MVAPNRTRGGFPFGYPLASWDDGEPATGGRGVPEGGPGPVPMRDILTADDPEPRPCERLPSPFHHQPPPPAPPPPPPRPPAGGGAAGGTRGGGPAAAPRPRGPGWAAARQATHKTAGCSPGAAAGRTAAAGSSR